MLTITMFISGVQIASSVVSTIADIPAAVTALEQQNGIPNQSAAVFYQDQNGSGNGWALIAGPNGNGAGNMP